MASAYWRQVIDSFSTWLHSDTAYECCYCDIQFQNDSLLFQHVEQVHKVRRDTYQMDNQHFAVRTEVLACQICSQFVLNVTGHLRKSRQMDPELYFMRFVFMPVTYQPWESIDELVNHNPSVEKVARLTEYHDMPEDKYIEADLYFVTIGEMSESEIKYQGKPHKIKLPEQVSPRNPQHSCTICQKSFQSNRHLERHVRSHTGEKPFACDLCGKAFSVKSNAKVHRRQHTGERPFKCQSCGKAFMYQSSLSQHKKKGCM